MPCECECNEEEARRCRTERDEAWERHYTVGQAAPMTLSPDTVAAVTAPTTTALAVTSAREQQLTAEVERLMKIDDKSSWLALSSLCIGIIGGGFITVACPPAGLPILAAGVVGLASGFGIAIPNARKAKKAKQELRQITDERTNEQKRIADETRQRTEAAEAAAKAAYAERVRAAAQAVLAGIPEKTHLAAGKSAIGFKAPDDAARHLVLLVTEITEYREDSASEPQQRVIVRVHRQPEDGGEIAQSPQIPGIGPLSILRPMPPVYGLTAPRPRLPQASAFPHIG